MFLYAHLVLKGLKYCHSVSEIRRDLKLLPTDLTAAYYSPVLVTPVLDLHRVSYGRIFTRINQALDPAAREKARKALGWIGCSPVPLTTRELEQALLINIGDINQDLSGISTVPLDRLCGPVIEEIDGELHLVHFTAKE